MKAVQLKAPYQIEIVDLPSSPLGAGEARVRIACSGICGSDMAIIRGANPFAKYPVVPGHEFSGVVSELAERGAFKVGQRVYVKPLPTCGHCAACLKGESNHCAELQVLGVHRNGAYAEEIVVPVGLLRALPDAMSFDEGAMIEPTAIGVNINNRAATKPGDKVAIFGAGVIGLLAAQVAKARGAAVVFASDVIDSRLELAKTLGVDVTANAKRDDVVKLALAEVGAFDVVVDLAGPKYTMNQAIALAKPGGRIMLLVPPEEPQVTITDYTAFFRKELSLHVSRLYGDDFYDAAPMIA
ncbi:MAG: zinc-dependent alcohol dehydrogenase, partial [Chloroflexota bacterium]